MMKYFKNKETGLVYAYDDAQLAQASRLTELELLIAEIEPTFIEANNQLQKTLSALKEAQSLFEAEAMSSPEDESLKSERDERLKTLEIDIEVKTELYNEALTAFECAESEYMSLKTEYDAILPIFFDIRNNINSMKKMSQKEIDAHLNPPISKEQLIAEAEQQKQSLLAEANNAIAPLQDAVDFGVATDNEIVSLREWKEYRITLNRVDTSTVPDIEWPEKQI
ncbi:tail fiber assembly protein [Providencia sp. PROV178]|uniref:tail fiber assembly protein n=1 Tax=Providencia sp. PROV178 TaxID=2949881 RepID=UPI00234BB0E9|nr:tail fiber assembly protein [Providencia sp. PROV178]